MVYSKIFFWYDKKEFLCEVLHWYYHSVISLNSISKKNVTNLVNYLRLWLSWFLTYFLNASFNFLIGLLSFLFHHSQYLYHTIKNYDGKKIAQFLKYWPKQDGLHTKVPKYQLCVLLYISDVGLQAFLLFLHQHENHSRTRPYFKLKIYYLFP